MSYRGDDGLGFAAERPASDRRIEHELRVRLAGPLVDGALFVPSAMEDKWALYLQRGRVLCIRSWTRALHLAADVHVGDREAVIGPLTGHIVSPDEPVAATARMFDYLFRLHVLGEQLPAPLDERPQDVDLAAIACFSLWGRRALFATHHELPPSSPRAPLRSLRRS